MTQKLNETAHETNNTLMNKQKRTSCGIVFCSSWHCLNKMSNPKQIRHKFDFPIILAAFSIYSKGFFLSLVYFLRQRPEHAFCSCIGGKKSHLDSPKELSLYYPKFCGATSWWNYRSPQTGASVPTLFLYTR